MTSAAAIVATALAACGDDPASKRPNGQTCAGSAECASGLCGGGICLDPARDDDSDGLINALEVNILGTDPTKMDTDGDGKPDGEEVDTEFGGVDTDGDGKDDALESATSDIDGDCIPDQYDAEDGVNNSDLSPLIDVLCEKVGVCAAGLEQLRVVCVEDINSARCDYDLVAGYEAEEVSCDGLDNDCDGETDEGAAASACVPVLVGIALNPNDLELTVDDTETLVATGTFDDASSRDISTEVTWTSAVPALATVSDAGVVTAIAPGSTAITAALDGETASAVVRINARPRALTRIALTPVDASTPLGISVAFTATGHYDDDTSDDLTTKVSWASSVTDTATISAAGVATPVATGETIITAQDESVTGSTKLTVVAATIDTVVLGPTGLIIPDGTTSQLTAIATLSDQTTLNVAATLTWSSDREAVATVDAAGLVTAHGAGTATITATDGVGSWTLDVAVGAPVAVSIMIEAGEASVGEGQMLQLAAIGAMSNGTEQDLSDQVTWASDNDAVATVDDVGVVTGVLAGLVDITATLDDIVGVVAIDVFVPIPLTLVVSSPAVRVIALGEPTTVSASPPVRTVVLESTMPSAGGSGIGDLTTITASPPVRAVVLESTMPSAGGSGIGDLTTITASPPVRTVVLESTMPSAGGSGIGDLTTITASPPVRAIVIESEDGTANLNTVSNRIPVKVDFADNN